MTSVETECNLISAGKQYPVEETTPLLQPSGQRNNNRQQTMKNQQKFRRLMSIVPVIALIVFIPACATQTGDVAKSDVQSALVQAGFKVKTATTAQQRQHLQSLPEHQFTAVTQNGENFYVWADKPNKRLYCGNEQAYRAYKKYRKAQRAREEGAITWIKDPGGYAIPVTVYHGWAPFREW